MMDVATIQKAANNKLKTQKNTYLILVFELLLIILIGTFCDAASGQSALPDIFRSEDLLWELQLGTHQYTIPKVDGDRIYIGTNDMALKHPAAKRTGPTSRIGPAL